MARADSHRWQFKTRFRRHAFGWRSQPAVLRVREATTEIRKAARQDPVLAAEGAVTLLERLSPALENVDSSSGAIGTAVNHAIAELVPIVAGAPSDAPTREAWLERLWAALEADAVPYIESLGDRWGELCASKPVAPAWADRLIGLTRLALGPDKDLHGHFHGTSACLSALHSAGRHAETLDLLQADAIWPYKRWAVKALAEGRRPRPPRSARGAVNERDDCASRRACGVPDLLLESVDPGLELLDLGPERHLLQHLLDRDPTAPTAGAHRRPVGAVCGTSRRPRLSRPGVSVNGAARGFGVSAAARRPAAVPARSRRAGCRTRAGTSPASSG